MFKATSSYIEFQVIPCHIVRHCHGLFCDWREPKGDKSRLVFLMAQDAAPMPHGLQPPICNLRSREVLRIQLLCPVSHTSFPEATLNVVQIEHSSRPNSLVNQPIHSIRHSLEVIHMTHCIQEEGRRRAKKLPWPSLPLSVN